MNNPADELLKEQLEKQATERAAAEVQWKASVDREDAEMKVSHVKKEYTFTQDEARQVLTAVTSQALAKEIDRFSQQLINLLINHNVFPRLNLEPDPNKKVLFEPTLGRIVVWIPKEAKVAKNKLAKDPA